MPSSPPSPPTPPPPPPSPPPIPPTPHLLIRLALRMHDCSRNGAHTGDDGHEYLDRELGTDFFLDSFFADKRRFPPERPWDEAGRDLLGQFEALMCKLPRWRREDCGAWLQDYWWVKALLDKEVKKIAKEAMEAAWEDGRRVERESYERQLRLIKEKNAKGQEALRDE